MVNKWLSRVMGQAVVESVPARRVSALTKVLGEAEDSEDEKADSPEPEDKQESPKQEPLPAPATDKPEAAVDADIEAGAESSADDTVISQTVAHLVSAWESGSKMDVASELLYTAVSYTDFVRMLFQIGEQAGVELGGMLDELSEVQPSIDQPGGGRPPEADQGNSAGRILSRVAQHRRTEKPVIQPAGESSPELDTAP